MKKSASAFKTYLNELKQQIKKADQLPNPAFGLYLADARTPAFRLEGLARLYATLHDKKFFSKLNKQAKQLEDGLGAVDHYTVLEKEFAPNAKVPIEIKTFFAVKADEVSEQLNKTLRKEKWLDGGRIKSVKENLKEIEWLSQKDEIASITAFYKKETAAISAYIQDCKFTDMENDVHELRRKLRWLSIYATALQGKVALVETEETSPAFLKKYLTPKVVNSPFNKIVASPKLKRHVQLNKNYFLALSWMIAELGSIKDDGLRIMALTEALTYGEAVSEKQALKKAYTILGPKYPTTEALLKKSATISKTFLKEGILEKLVL